MLVLFFVLLPAALAGNNGLAQTPPLSWRSWNAFNWHISAATALNAARGLVDTSRAIIGRPAGASLASLGFASVGLDEGWAQCIPKGASPEGWEFHKRNIDGSISPLVNETLFPDMKGLVETIHSLNLSAGWYLNPCFSYCWALGETGCGDECNAGDVLATLAYGFDAVKIDGCSSQHNTTLFAQLFNDSGIPMLIENCHDEQQPSKPIAAGGCDDYHTYRASTDIRNTYGSWVLNAYSVQQYTDGRTGPSCWAYADMLMVGVGPTCAGDTCAEPPLPSVTEQRTHFGLWCVISSPLTLSMDFANATLVDAVWPIVTNVAAIAVNQAWAGAPGGQLLADYSANVTLQHCTPTWANDLNCTLPRTQVWWKPLPGGAAAIFIANHDDAAAHDVRVEFSQVPSPLPCAPACEVTDVWTQTETGVHTGAYAATLQPHDSAFVVLHSAGAPWKG